MVGVIFHLRLIPALPSIVTAPAEPAVRVTRVLPRSFEFGLIVTPSPAASTGASPERVRVVETIPAIYLPVVSPDKEALLPRLIDCPVAVVIEPDVNESVPLTVKFPTPERTRTPLLSTAKFPEIVLSAANAHSLLLPLAFTSRFV